VDLTRAERAHLRRALAVASTSTERQRHGAVVAVGKRVLAVAVNSARNHPMVCTHPKTQAAWHAEVAALRQLRGADLSNATLFVARLMRDGTAGNSKPCLRCQGAVDVAGVGRVVWTTEGGGWDDARY
jgi:tRNA(Arg) A34 adenosine deaminase TadA